MNVLVLNIVVVLSMFVVDIASQLFILPSLDCNKLPKVKVPTIQKFSEFSPYEIVSTLSPTFDCSTEVFTYPARGATNYSGSALSVKGGEVITFDYVVGSDGQSLNVTTCNDGLTTVWHVAYAQFDDTGGYFCVYSCNGKKLAEFDCRSNIKKESPGQTAVVMLAKTVSNGYLIHDGSKNCTVHKACNAF